MFKRADCSWQFSDFSILLRKKSSLQRYMYIIFTNKKFKAKIFGIFFYSISEIAKTKSLKLLGRSE